MIQKFKTNSKHNFIKTIIVFFVLSFFSNITIFSQTSKSSTDTSSKDSQNINLAISKVNSKTIDYKTTRNRDGIWEFENFKLNKDDYIKYQWDTVDINLKNKIKPFKNAGYLKVYKDDCDKADNFVVDTGADDYPFGLSKVDTQLGEGSNLLCFIYVNENNIKTKNFSFLRFNYSKLKPKVNIKAPTLKQVFSKDQNNTITVEVDDFSPSEKDVLNIFSNNDRNNSLIKINNPIKNGENYKYEINSSVITALTNLPDSNDTVLNFEIINTITGETLSESSVGVITNFNNTLNSDKNPKINIISPSKEVNNSVNENTKFLFSTENFYNLINKDQQGNPKKDSEIEGYIQIIVNNIPLSTKFNKNEFTLNDLKFQENTTKDLEIKIKLVNSNFEKFSPEVTDTIKVGFSPSQKVSVDSTNTSKPNNQWKIIIIALTILIIIISVIVSVVRS